MTRPLRAEYEGAFYHIMARGQRQENIFISDKDRKQFLERVAITVDKYNLHLHAYCLMDNHYHFLLETPDGNLSQAMRYLNGSYANYFRVKHRLEGSIFQGRYKSIVVEKDDYLLQLSAYIHLNPVRANMVEKPEEYKWSSFKYYLGKESIPEFLYSNELWEKYGRNYYKYVYEIMGMEKNDIEAMFDVKKSVLGSDALRLFVIDCEEKRKGVDKDIELPEFRKLKQVSKENVLQLIVENFEVSEAEIFNNRRGNIYRKLFIYGLKRYTPLKVREIGELYGIDYQAVSSQLKYFKRQIDMNIDLLKMKEKFDKLISKQSRLSKIPI